MHETERILPDRTENQNNAAGTNSYGYIDLQLPVKWKARTTGHRRLSSLGLIKRDPDEEEELLDMKHLACHVFSIALSLNIYMEVYQ